MSEITITVRQAVEINQALLGLANVKIPTRQSYRIGKLLRKLAPEVKQFNETQLELFQKHGAVADKEANTWSFENDRDGLVACQKELEEVLTEEIKLVGVAKVVIEELEAAGVEIEPNVLMLADPVLTENAE